MATRVTLDYVLARWAYSELLSIEQGHKYQLNGISDIREKARHGVPFEDLDQSERSTLLSAWHAVRSPEGSSVFSHYLQGVEHFQVVQWKKEDLGPIFVIPYFATDVVSEHLSGLVQIPFKLWIEATPVRPLHQWHARFAASAPDRSALREDPLTVGRYPQGQLVLLDGYHRAVAFWLRTDPNATLPVYRPEDPPLQPSEPTP